MSARPGPPAPTSVPEATARPAAPDRPRVAAVAARSAPATRFAALAAGAVALLLLTWGALVGTTIGQRIENAALLGAEFRSSAEREGGLERLSAISTTMFGLAVVGLLLVALARRRAALGAVVAGTMVLSVLGAELLKEVVPRPELVDGPRWLLRNSFPSGTAAVAVAVAVGGFLVAPDRLRWIALPAGVLYAAVIGEATQATGWHRLSDVVGSMLLVIAVSSAGLVVLAQAGLVQPVAHGRVDARIRRTLAVIAVIALLLGVALLAVTPLFPLIATPAGSRRAFLQTAFPLLGGGLTVGGLVAFARVVEPFSLGRGARTGQEPRPAPRAPR